MSDPEHDSPSRGGESSPPAWAQFELLVAHLSDGVTVQDRSGRIVYANDVAAQTAGYATAEEFLAAPSGDYIRKFEVMTENGDPLPLEQLPGRRAMLEGTGEGVLQVRARATNAVRWSDVRAFVVHDETGEAMFVVNVFRDITERVVQQRLLEAQTRELEAQSAQAQSLTEELEQSNEQLADSLLIEHEALRREGYLSRATDLLSESLDFEATLQRVASLVVPELADWSTVDLLSETTGELRQLVVAHADPEKVQWARRLHDRFPRDMDAPRGIPNVLRTGVPELHPVITDEGLVASARNDEELSLLRAVGLRSVMIVPLRAHRRIVGTITFVTAESNKSYTEADLAFAVELGRRAGMAIERAALHQDTVRARDAASAAFEIAEERATWLTRLQRLTGELSRSVTASDVIDAATTLGRELFEADRGAVWMFDESRQTLSLAGRHSPAEEIDGQVRSMSIVAPYPIAEALRSDELVLLEDQATMLACYPELANVPGISETHAGVAVPLKVGTEIIGGLTYAYNHPRGFSTDYITALHTFSRELGQSLQRTKTMADLLDSRTAADSANRAKSAFLATMSHEFRTPINAIMGFTDLLAMRVADGDTEGQTLYLNRIRKNTEHVLALVSDVLDWSKVEAGQLNVDTREREAADVIVDALGIVGEQARSRGLALVFDVADSATYVGDPLRVKQILLNLLSNGIKFTPSGGRVSLECSVDGAVTHFAVEDTGIGIDASDLESIFEPFVQAEGGYTRTHDGTGLGLSISRRLARLMGGNIVVEFSVPGQGSKFVVSLPSRERRKSSRGARRQPSPS